MILKGNAVVGQSGGPTAAINATLAGVIRGALNARDEGVIENLYGMRYKLHIKLSFFPFIIFHTVDLS